MADNFVGEIRIVPFNFAPAGWAMCNGQIIPISQNTALFSLLGTFYGGDGQTNFALPNLQGSAPVMMGSQIGIGQSGGTETVTLTAEEMPAHTHTPNASSSAASQPSPVGNLWAQGAASAFSTGAPNSVMNPQSIVEAGVGNAHNNLQPYLVLNFIIALQGVFPTRS